MKTNLDSHFLADEELETNGVWFDITEDVGFLVARYSPDVKEVQKAAAKVMKPYAAKIRAKTISDEEAVALGVKAFVHGCVKDWRGVVIDGQEVPFSKEECVKLFIKRPQLFRTIESYASDIENYKEELGNS